MKKNYSVKQLSLLAGVSVRTLHLYDQKGLLRPSVRTEAGYRQYGEQELLRLQQILFYKMLGFPLKEIAAILDDPDFDRINALKKHRLALKERKKRIGVLLETIDNTLVSLQQKTMLPHESLYKGLTPEEALAYRQEAAAKYGINAVERAEKSLKKLNSEELEILKTEAQEIQQALFSMLHEDPESEKVQQLIARHYKNIRQLWGTSKLSDPQAEAYAGLGELYVQDTRYIRINGKTHPELALFLCKAMRYFAAVQLS